MNIHKRIELGSLSPPERGTAPLQGSVKPHAIGLQENSTPRKEKGVRAAQQTQPGDYRRI